VEHQFFFYPFWRDVTTEAGNETAFLASGEIEIAVLIQMTQVTAGILLIIAPGVVEVATKEISCEQDAAMLKSARSDR